MRSLSLAFAMAILLAGCGKNGQLAIGESGDVSTVKQFVMSRLGETPNPTMTLNAEEESWNTVLRLKNRPVGWLRPNIGCGTSAPDDNKLRINPSVENYSGNLLSKSRSDIFDNAGSAGQVVSDLGLMQFKSDTLTGGLGDKMDFTCQVYADDFYTWKSKNASIVSGTASNPVILLAIRGPLKYPFENEYKTEIPGKGNASVVSLNFTYPMIVKFPGLVATSEGAGSAKAYYDNDTGKWNLTEFSFKDGNLSWTQNSPSHPKISIDTLKKGNGPSPKNDDAVLVNYKGYLPNGSVFDSGQKVAMPLKAMIPGFSQGLQRMQKGGVYHLTIPPQLAYGIEGSKDAQGKVVIPGNSQIMFEIELLDFLNNDVLKNLQDQQNRQLQQK